MTFAATLEEAMTRFEIPDYTIEAFERIHDLNVTVHDLTGSLTPFLKPYRFHHRSPLCLAVKGHGHHASCFQFELNAVRRDLTRLPEGRIQVCHAGLLEWVVPVFEKQKLSWILFAGPRFPGKKLYSAVVSRKTRWLKSPWIDKRGLLSSVDEDEAQLIMEHLRQLAARLLTWSQNLKLRRSSGAKESDFSSHPAATRETIVLRFIEDGYAQSITLPMLAKKLCLSESRASHVVKRCCGTSFRELLIQKRLSVAMDLLRRSGMSILEVTLASGFDDLAHFHRIFRRRIGTTPGRYRISGRS